MANVSLGEKFEKYLEEKVGSGDYMSASEVIRDALRLKMQVEAEEAAKLARLRGDIDAALAQADAGDLHEFDVEAFLASEKSVAGG